MTAVYPPRAGVRECRLYRFWVTHPLTGEVVLGYIGETGRQPFERLLEHLATQPWFDTVVRWEIDEQIFWGKAAVEAAEAAAIHAELPLYNYEHNLDNPRRIEIWRAKEQRWARDAQQGRRPWTPAPDRNGGGARRPPSRPKVVRRQWSSRRKHLTGLAVAVAVLTIVGWSVRAYCAELSEPWWCGVPAGALAATVWAWSGCPVTKRGRRTAWHRVKRRLK